MWYSIIVVLIFNTMDTIGRKMAVIFKLSLTLVYVLGILRFVFIFTSIFLAVSDISSSMFEKTYVKLINLILFAFSNGYVSTNAAMHVRSFVDESQREQIGKFVSMFLGYGTMIGCAMAVPIGSLLSDHPSFYQLHHIN